MSIVVIDSRRDGDDGFNERSGPVEGRARESFDREGHATLRGV